MAAPASPGVPKAEHFFGEHSALAIALQCPSAGLQLWLTSWSPGAGLLVAACGPALCPQPALLSQVVFTISNETRKFHVPLLLSPWSYTTYRGS